MSSFLPFRPAGLASFGRERDVRNSCLRKRTPYSIPANSSSDPHSFQPIRARPTATQRGSAVICFCQCRHSAVPDCRPERNKKKKAGTYGILEQTDCPALEGATLQRVDWKMMMQLLPVANIGADCILAQQLITSTEFLSIEIDAGAARRCTMPWQR